MLGSHSAFGLVCSPDAWNNFGLTDEPLPDAQYAAVSFLKSRVQQIAERTVADVIGSTAE